MTQSTNSIIQLPKRYHSERPTLRLSPAQLSARSAFLEASSTEKAFERLNCPVCKNDAPLPLSSYDRYGLKHPVGICQSCGLLYSYEVLREKYLDLFYSKFYRDLYSVENDPRSLFESQRSKAKSVYSWVQKHLLKKEPRSVLEIGCGAGGILSLFKDNGFECMGIDLDQKNLDFGKSQGLQLFNSSVQQFEPGRVFDVIILSHVLEHFTDPGAVLAKLRSWITQSSVIYIEVPSIHSISYYNYQGRIGDLLTYLQSAHISYFSVQTFAELARQAGFQIAAHDDFIRSIWRLEADVKPSTLPAIENHFDSTLRLIKNLERMRPLRASLFKSKSLIRELKSLVYRTRRILSK